MYSVSLVIGLVIFCLLGAALLAGLGWLLERLLLRRLIPHPLGLRLTAILLTWIAVSLAGSAAMMILIPRLRIVQWAEQMAGLAIVVHLMLIPSMMIAGLIGFFTARRKPAREALSLRDIADTFS